MFSNNNGMITIVIELSNLIGRLNTQLLVYSQYCEVMSISYWWWKGITNLITDVWVSLILQ